MPVARQSARDRIDHAAAQELRYPLVAAAIVLVEVAVVSAEQLVAADARENHGHLLARELRHEVGRDERRIRDRLIHVPDQAGSNAQRPAAR